MIGTVLLTPDRRPRQVSVYKRKLTTITIDTALLMDCLRLNGTGSIVVVTTIDGRRWRVSRRPCRFVVAISFSSRRPAALSRKHLPYARNETKMSSTRRVNRLCYDTAFNNTVSVSRCTLVCFHCCTTTTTVLWSCALLWADCLLWWYYYSRACTAALLLC